MILADHIFIDGDTAWLVVADPTSLDEWDRPQTWRRDDRPCDTCGGSGDEYPYSPKSCSNCHGTGRHVFTIEVECDGLTEDCWHKLPTHVRTIRVNVIPDMVLPITEDTDLEPEHGPHIIQFDGRSGGEPYTEFVPCDGRMTDDPITLPPSAGIGMWAVKLKIHNI